MNVPSGKIYLEVSFAGSKGPSSLWRTTALFQAKKHNPNEGGHKGFGEINVLKKRAKYTCFLRT
jgi:hypothetical protein